jgi:predicted alpha/beta-hydrolase family hydrolase
MALKRRISRDVSAIPESNKRVTRSSTKQGLSTIPDSAAADSQPQKNTLKSKNKSERKDVKYGDKEEEEEDKDSASPYSTFSIHSDLTKTPVQCHIYRSPTQHQPTLEPTLIFTHGAGGTLSAPAVTRFCTGYASALPVLAFQGSANLGARVKAFRACHAYFRSQQAGGEDRAGRDVLFGGRSMGARAAAMAAAELMGSDGGGEGGEKMKVRLVLVSYPLVGPKGELRDGILLYLSDEVDVLFVSGDRDAMCPLSRLEEVRGKMAAKSRLVVVRGADHGMHTRPAGLEKEVGEETGRRAAEWVMGEMGEDELYVGEG